MVDSNRRIYKNTIFLTLRMILSIFISFYSTRFILQSLGVVDYGIYSVVGGVIAFFTFFNNALTSSTQRHISFQIGKGDAASMNKVFNASLRIHIIICGIILIICETFGLYFFENFLKIPLDRISAGRWVYHTVVVMLLFNIMNVPFQAIINAKEDMHVVATRGILESVSKLIIGISLLYIDFPDKLVTYSILTLTVTAILSCSYFVYCKRSYVEIFISNIKIDKPLYIELVSFASWTLFGILGSVSRTQGLSILLNIFYGPVLNAAFGIANQFSTQVQSFADTIIKPFNPQIVQAYSQGDNGRTFFLAQLSSRYSNFLSLLICIPIFFKIDFVLDFWLDDYPPETVIITKLVLVNLVFSIITNPLITVMQATGNIKLYQVIIGSLFIFNIPIAYFLLKQGNSYYSVFISLIVITLITNVIKIFFVHYYLKFSLPEYLQLVVLRPVLIILVVTTCVFLTRLVLTFSNSFLNNFIESIFIFLCTGFSILFIGLHKKERISIMKKIRI